MSVLIHRKKQSRLLFLFGKKCSLYHLVTWTPNDWMPKASSDKEQLLGAMAHDRILFSFNIKDFEALVKVHTEHKGLVLAARSSWTLSALIHALDRLLTETDANEWLGQTRYLNQWRS